MSEPTMAEQLYIPSLIRPYNYFTYYIERVESVSAGKYISRSSLTPSYFQLLYYQFSFDFQLCYCLTYSVHYFVLTSLFRGRCISCMQVQIDRRVYLLSRCFQSSAWSVSSTSFGVIGSRFSCTSSVCIYIYIMGRSGPCSDHNISISRGL